MNNPASTWPLTCRKNAPESGRTTVSKPHENDTLLSASSRGVRPLKHGLLLEVESLLRSGLDTDRVFLGLRDVDGEHLLRERLASIIGSKKQQQWE
jgi:hypothetical protein